MSSSFEWGLRTLFDISSRLGSTTWNGLPLHNGYQTRIGGRDVELDLQITASQMPDIIGSTQEHDDDEEMASEPSQFTAGPSFLPQALQKVTESPGPSSAPKFIAPASFYGAPPPKPKPKEPLCVFLFPL